MHLSFAPMEGIVKYTFRNLQKEMFPGADDYYSPFIAPDSRGNCKNADLRDVLPENNPDIRLIPQILTNSADAFLSAAGQLSDLGYREVNLNAGCPSGTVVSKHKGAGMLQSPQELDLFLSQVFDGCNMAVSVKTRIGMHSSEEFPALLEVYNKYPIERLIIHVRTRDGLYKSEPDHRAFAYALEHSKNHLCYNGNIFAPGDLEAVKALHPAMRQAMAGRGAVTNPALFRELKGGAPLSKAELREFHDRYLSLSLSSGLSEHFALQRMKEHWAYMSALFPEDKKLIKAIFKATKLPDYRSAVTALFVNGQFTL